MIAFYRRSHFLRLSHFELNSEQALNREIDFLVASGERLKFLECKWTQYPDERDIKTASEIREFLAKKQKVPPEISSYMIARTETSYPKSPQFQVISGLKLAEIFKSCRSV